MQFNDLDEKLYPADTAVKVALAFYVAHRPGSDPQMSIRRMTINGIEVARRTLHEQIALPGKQGWCINLGLFSPAEKLDFEWSLETQDIGSTAQIALGIFRDGRLTQRTVFATLTPDSYREYPGKGSAVV